MEHQAVYERPVCAAREGEFVHHGALTRKVGVAMENPQFGALGKVLGEDVFVADLADVVTRIG